MYTLSMDFNTVEEIRIFLDDKTKTIPKPKKENDRRGQNVKQLHINAKEYKINNPEIKYKECLKLANVKQNN